MLFYYYDWTYMLVVIGAVICLAASARVNRVFARYSTVRSHSGMTGREAAEQILHRNGIYDVQVIHIPGNLTDHYNPGKKTLGLSDTVYNSTSVAAIAACCGIRAPFDPRGAGAGGEYRFFCRVASDYCGAFPEWSDIGIVYQSWHPAFLCGSSLSACDAAGRV